MGNYSKKPSKGLAADNRTPWVGVHVITEFMFCPRAGLIAYEKGQQEEYEEENFDAKRPNLTYIPCYDLNQIEMALGRALQDLKRLFKILLIASVVSIFAAAVISASLSLGFSGFVGFTVFALIVVAFIGLQKIIPLNRRIKILRERRWAAQKAKAMEPNPRMTDNELVNWWDLLKAGFESRSYREPLLHPHWKVAGRPWRVLRKGSLRIPVWKRRKGDNLNKKLKGQHYARMAAYCHLIEKSEGGQSPYGIILLGDESYEGITVSNGPGSRSAFHKGLREARRVILAAQNNNDPRAPQSTNRCSNCPSGKPFAYREGISNNRSGRLNSSVNAQQSSLDNRYYHSECGDRFNWLPPHVKATEKSLRHY